MSNDALRHQMTELMALAQEQLADIAAVQRKQAALTASGESADGLVEVTVDARGHVIKTAIDENYLDEYEFAELAEHITEAARAAAQSVSQRVHEMMAPIIDSRKRFPSLSEILDGAPELPHMTVPWSQTDVEPRPHILPPDHNPDDTSFPIVRR